MEKIPENKMEKIGKNKFRLTTNFERVERIDVFDKQFLIESYRAGVEEYNKVSEELKKANKKLKENQYTKEEEDDIVKFIELNNKAHKYNEYQKALSQRDNMVDMMKRLSKQKEDIEKVCPEVKRAKK